jgi:hypothetical protein
MFVYLKVRKENTLTNVRLEVAPSRLLDDLFANMMPLGAAALPLHLVPRIELNVGRLDEELLVPLLDLLLQRGRVHPGQGVAVQGDQLGGNLHSTDRKKLDPNMHFSLLIFKLALK